MACASLSPTGGQRLGQERPASDGCHLLTRGQKLLLRSPHVVHDPMGHRPVERQILRMLRVSDFLVLVEGRGVRRDRARATEATAADGRTALRRASRRFPNQGNGRSLLLEPAVRDQDLVLGADGEDKRTDAGDPWVAQPSSKANQPALWLCRQRGS